MAPVRGVVDISSDEEEGLSMGDPLGWMSDLFDVEDDAVGEDVDDLMVMSEISAPPVLHNAATPLNLLPSLPSLQRTGTPDDLLVKNLLSRLPPLQKKAGADAGCDEDDDDCVVLDGDPDKAVTVADEEGSAGDGGSDELQIVAEKGPIACRDFPHSRHSCSNLPFSSTPHLKHCNMCHCFVCDAPAPCKYWGNSASADDHCHATDKEEKWKKLRHAHAMAHKKLPAPGQEKHLNNAYSTMSSPRQQPMQCHVSVPQSPSVSYGIHPSLAIQSPLLNEGIQNRQRHPSVRVSLSVGAAVSSPRSGRGTGNSHIAQNAHSHAVFKRAGPVSPGLGTTNASQFSSSAPNDSLVHQALLHPSQTVQVAPTTNAFTATSQNRHFLRSFSAPIAAQVQQIQPQVQQIQPAAYCQVATNGIHATGPQLSRCTSLTTQRTQFVPDPAIDVGTTSWEDILASVSADLGVADYDISTAESQHVMTDSQPKHPTANHRFSLQPEPIAESENLTYPIVHDLSNHAAHCHVQTDGAVGTSTTENWDHLIDESNLVPTEAHLNDFVGVPADGLSIEEATHQLEISRLESTNILFEFDLV
ncbi:hypothetical protein BS78_01G211000 [Paspalum vaginatum]|nr:hypothetical protein BS78_01G211000 [Paspalum vaginatum]KAJ1295276.1 hypothetical protein BS78_01G211000 [Paspalum vaginatum]